MQRGHRYASTYLQSSAGLLGKWLGADAPGMCSRAVPGCLSTSTRPSFQLGSTGTAFRNACPNPAGMGSGSVHTARSRLRSLFVSPFILRRHSAFPWRAPGSVGAHVLAHGAVARRAAPSGSLRRAPGLARPQVTQAAATRCFAASAVGLGAEAQSGRARADDLALRRSERALRLRFCSSHCPVSRPPFPPPHPHAQARTRPGLCRTPSSWSPPTSTGCARRPPRAAGPLLPPHARCIPHMLRALPPHAPRAPRPAGVRSLPRAARPLRAGRARPPRPRIHDGAPPWAPILPPPHAFSSRPTFSTPSIAKPRKNPTPDQPPSIASQNRPSWSPSATASGCSPAGA